MNQFIASRRRKRTLLWPEGCLLDYPKLKSRRGKGLASQCSAYRKNWIITTKLGGSAWIFALPCTVMTPSQSWGVRMHFLHVRYQLWIITAVIICMYMEIGILSNLSPLPEACAASPFPPLDIVCDPYTHDNNCMDDISSPSSPSRSICAGDRHAELVHVTVILPV